MTTRRREWVRKYVASSRQYLQNALLLLQQEEPGKAGELLWGSMAEALQAIAANQGIELANHRSLRYFASQLTREQNDPTLSQGFRLAESLHHNFYEVEFETSDLVEFVEPIRLTIEKLLALIPPEALEEAAPA